jgi:dsRNA-specific ribonuclease
MNKNWLVNYGIDVTIENVERILNYSLKNRAYLLKEALTHRFLKALNYEWLEFLGDVVLGNFTVTT